MISVIFFTELLLKEIIPNSELNKIINCKDNFD